jgi:hypothetical protein
MLIVVTRYKENLDFLDAPEFCRAGIEYIVYNKGGGGGGGGGGGEDLKKPNNPRVTYIELENVGMCDHTVFYHIVNNYDNLHDTTLFIPASIGHPDMKYKLDKTLHILNAAMESPGKSVFKYEEKYENIKEHYKNFIINYWNPRHESNREANYKIDSNYGQLIPSKYRPFSAWYNNHFGDTITNYVSLWCIFAVSREYIHRRPIEFYMDLLEELSVGANIEVGHYMERAWQAVFSIPNLGHNKNTIIV